MKSTDLWSLLYRYSDITRLLRITAWIMRAWIARFQQPSEALIGPLIIHELEASKIYWVKRIQQSAFQREFSVLLKGQILPKSNLLLRLTPIMDSNGLLRIGGRLHLSLLPADAKHPLILPRKSAFTSLIIADAHSRTMHYARNQLWHSFATNIGLSEDVLQSDLTF